MNINAASQPLEFVLPNVHLVKIGDIRLPPIIAGICDSPALQTHPPVFLMVLSDGKTDRTIFVLSGEPSECLSHAKKLTVNLHCLELDNPKKANDYLGQEFDAVIFHAHERFDPNAFGAVTGTIRGGGYLLLLKPDNWPKDSLFLKRFNQLLEDKQVHFLNPTEIPEPLSTPTRRDYNDPFATKDQEQAVEAIIRVVKGHRRRPLVITADRGRGKSAALGIAAAKLAQDGINNIIVCAPSKKTAAVIFQHAQRVNPESTLHFYAPDELHLKKPKADLVLIDEAAAIPVSLLSSFLKHYSRIVFASTQHGYEGSGRGFSISFRKVLDKLSPEWKSCQLTTPIRWQENDSLEQFVFEALLLNAEPADDILIKDAKLSNCSFSLIDKTTLIKNSLTLKELFGLLVNAHYQTKPSDLMQLLDDEMISVFVLRNNSSIIAVSLLVQEGIIDPQLAIDIFEGTRRLKGHLVAQSLAANVGIPTAPKLHGERIIRIAVHPALQNQSFGTHLLTSLSENSKADYLSTSFGATVPLLEFWKKSDFTAVYLGMRRDASSGTHSVIMLQAKNDHGEALMKEAKLRFAKSFPHQLSDPLRELETDIALSLLAKQASKSISSNEAQQLQAFAYKQRGYETSFYPIWKLVCNRLVNCKTLSQNEKKILLLKAFQKHSWIIISHKMAPDIHGKKDALQLLRQAVSRLID